MAQEGRTDIIIIGAGMAGLSAGCYGQMNGYRTRIFEMHDKPGGLCTAWDRQGYTIDGCLHWLVGTAPGSGLHQMWLELGALQGKEIVDHEEFVRIEGPGGEAFTIYTNIDRLRQHMLELAPQDEAVIEEFVAGLRKFTRFNLASEKAPEVAGPLDGLKMLVGVVPFLGALRKWQSTSLQDFAERFTHPLIRRGLQEVWIAEFPALFVLMTLAWMHRKDAGYTVGGSLPLAHAVERRYLDLGGETVYRAPVERILVEDDRAVGVRLADGSEHRADVVISAADGHATIFDMLEGKYVNDTIRGYFEELPVFPPLVFVGLGVNRSFEEETCPTVSIPLEEPIMVAGKEQERLNVHLHNYDPTLAPEGKTSLTVMIPSDYDYWTSLREDRERYRAEKEAIADQVITALDRRFPGLADQVEMEDVATPATFHRYTGNWRGSFEGWSVTPETANVRMSKTLPGLEGFYMVGQWVEPGGGLPPSAMSGRNVIQILCKRDKRRFRTTQP